MTDYWKLRAAAISHLYGVTESGCCYLTPAGRRGLDKLIKELQQALLPTHTDNCDDGSGLSVCRVDLRDHDCCLTCNVTQDALQLVAEYSFDEGPT